jgi:excisionase family DNA binding protein
MTNIELQPLWTVRDVASAYQLAESTVRRLAHEGKLPAVKVGGSVRFRPGDLAALLERPADHAASEETA